MSPSISTMAKSLWKKMAGKEYRDSFAAAHISNNIAAQIAAMREAEGWTQKQLAQRAGMSHLAFLHLKTRITRILRLARSSGSHRRLMLR